MFIYVIGYIHTSIYIYIDMGINTFSSQEMGPVGMSNGTLKHFKITT